uniref:Uncharacterized protein n=1 Tax=Setaria italica TaxID=4555 RepID=K3ZKQ9_SETIT
MLWVRVQRVNQVATLHRLEGSCWWSRAATMESSSSARRSRGSVGVCDGVAQQRTATSGILRRGKDAAAAESSGLGFG